MVSYTLDHEDGYVSPQIHRLFCVYPLGLL